MRINVLRYCILPPGDVCLNLLKPSQPHHVPQRGVLPCLILLPPLKITQKPPCHPMVETPQHISDVGRHNPRLQSEHNNGLNTGEVGTPQHPSVHALPPQYWSKSRADFSGLTKVGYDSRPIVVGRCQEDPQIIRVWHCFQWMTISLYRHFWPLPILLIHQAPSISVIPLCTEVWLWVALVHRLPGYENITGRSEGKGVFSFLQNHFRVPHVVVH